jgi:hypothetical protein
MYQYAQCLGKHRPLEKIEEKESVLSLEKEKFWSKLNILWTRAKLLFSMFHTQYAFDLSFSVKNDVFPNSVCWLFKDAASGLLCANLKQCKR